MTLLHSIREDTRSDQNHRREMSTCRLVGCCPVHPSVAMNEAKWRIHDLNNQGCVATIAGRYTDANHLFETALRLQKQVAESNFSFQCRCECTGGESSVQRSPMIVDNDISSDSDDYGDDDSVMEEGWDEDKVSHFRWQEGAASPRIKRMAATSTLRKASSHGTGAAEDCYYQLYSLPIAMDTDEWEKAVVQERSFVLIFNSALCNHLMGLNLLKNQHESTTGDDHEKQDHREQALCRDQCYKAFTIARSLYHLALESVVSNLHTRMDRLSYIAIFNNLSHVCRMLHGDHSPEANHFERMLLRSIYWYRDAFGRLSQYPSASVNTSTLQTNHSTQNHQSSSPENNTIANENSTALGSTISPYEEADSEILDAFLGNVFHLICPPKNWAPAASA